MQLSLEELDACLHPEVTPEQPRPVLTGEPAWPGWVHGPLALHGPAEPGSILVHPHPQPADLAGVLACAALVTADDSAAILCPGWEKPGFALARFRLEDGALLTDQGVLTEREPVLLDGRRGRLYRGGPAPAPVESLSPELERALRQFEQSCPVRVWANADSPAEWLQGRRLGAQGIGLCRTEWMMGPLGYALVEAMLAGADLDPEPLQRDLAGHLRGLFRAAAGRPVVVRLLDAPLHQFLAQNSELERNPLLGLRWCRLGLRFPVLYRAQLQACLEAARKVAADLHILVPGPCLVEEMQAVRAMAEELAEGVPVRLGAMLELPRACIIADQLVPFCDFLAFGTNDLTQATLGLSREDARFTVIPSYLAQGLLNRDPFRYLDEGVLWLMREAIHRARRVRPDLTIGVCGDHAGVPANIPWLIQAGVNFLSCYPGQVPAVRLVTARSWREWNES